MTLSKQTLDHLCDAESHIRAAIRSAAMNEKPLVVKQLSEILMSMEQTKKFDEIMDMLDDRKPGSSGKFDSFFNDDDTD
tara:strand:+ start:739 stop:975 length:237 start_codon:yes stop_codon:yes gene_type:complete